MVTAVADEEFLSLIRFKLEALVELCHLSPALLLHGSIQACKLQMGFSWAFMQAGLHRSNICREQTAESWEAWAKEKHFQITSNTGLLNAIPVLAPGCGSWLKRPTNQSQKQIGIFQPDVNETPDFNASLLLFTLLCTTSVSFNLHNQIKSVNTLMQIWAEDGFVGQDFSVRVGLN